MQKIIKSNWIFAISAMAFFIISAFSGVLGYIASFIAMILFFVKKKNNPYGIVKSRWNNLPFSMAMLIVAILLNQKLAANLFGNIYIGLFKYMWGAKRQMLLHLLSGTLGALAIPFTLTLLDVLCSLIDKSKIIAEKKADADKQPDRKEIILMLLSSVVIITIRSKNSFIYPFNNWFDINAFFTMGKGVAKGLVMFRDVIDHKGPVLHFLFSIFYMISNESFFGVYLYEIIGCFVIEYCAYKCTALFTDKASVPILAVITAIFFNSPCFFNGGSVEEICAPLLAISFYILIKSVVSGTIPSFKNGILIGVLFALILWMKFTVVSFYIGFAITVFMYVRTKEDIKNILVFGAGVILGVIIVTAPILLYFAKNNALPQLYERYIADNLFNYNVSAGKSTRQTIKESVFIYSRYSAQTLLITAALIYYYKTNKKIFTAFAICFVATMFIAYIQLFYYQILSLIFICLAVPAITAICPKAEINKRSVIATFALCCLITFFSVNWSYLFTPKSELPQYKFKEIIYSEKDNPTLLNYGFLDGGFYTATGIVPTCAYFYQSNVINPEMLETQRYYVDNGLVDFVVTNGVNLESENYELVASENQYVDGIQNYFYLWKLKE